MNYNKYSPCLLAVHWCIPIRLWSNHHTGGVTYAPPCFGHVTCVYEDGGSFFFLEVKPRPETQTSCTPRAGTSLRRYQLCFIASFRCRVSDRNGLLALSRVIFSPFFRSRWTFGISSLP